MKMKNNYQKKKSKDILSLIENNKDDFWEWFLNPINEEKASLGQTNYRLYYSKLKDKNYLKEYKGTFTKVLAKREKVWKIKVARSNYHRDKSGTFSKDDLLKIKILRFLQKNNYDKETIAYHFKIKENKVTRLINQLKKARYVSMEKVYGDNSIQEKYVSNLYQLNLNLFFDFCELVNKNLPDKDKIIFTNKEKRILEILFGSDNSYIRGQVYSEYKNTHFLNAILKFYVKHFYLPYVDDKQRIKTKLIIGKESIKKIMSLNEEDFNEEQYILRSQDPSVYTKEFLRDFQKIKDWSVNTAMLWPFNNSTNIDKDDFNYYGGIYRAFEEYEKNIMEKLGWKMIRILALMNS